MGSYCSCQLPCIFLLMIKFPLRINQMSVRQLSYFMTITALLLLTKIWLDTLTNWMSLKTSLNLEFSNRFNPPNHLLEGPWYYHGDGSKIRLLPWPWQYHDGVGNKKIKYSSKSLKLPNSFRNGRKIFYCHYHGTTTAMEVL